MVMQLLASKFILEHQSLLSSLKTLLTVQTKDHKAHHARSQLVLFKTVHST